MSKILRVGGKDIDLSGVLPFKLRDWKKLKPLGVTPETLATNDLEVLSNMLGYAVQLIDPTITQDQVDELTLDDLSVIQEDGGEGVDRPTLIVSTDSPKPTDGDQEILTS